ICSLTSSFSFPTNEAPTTTPWFSFALWWIRSGRCAEVGRPLEFAPDAVEEPALPI
ncbi:hypothetical protein Csa_023954, partial [Cucumis sativus]